MLKKYEAKVVGCPVEDTLRLIGSKWTVLIIRDLLVGVQRFGELERSLTGISPRTLSMRLQYLEQEGIIERTVYAEVPPRVEYQLTELGSSLAPILETMNTWGIRFQRRQAKGSSKRIS